MAVTLLNSADTCVGAGTGLQTTWTLSGTTTAFSGVTAASDGYSIVASLTWVTISITSNSAGETLTGNDLVMGTCV